MKKSITLFACLLLLTMGHLSFGQRGPAASPKSTVTQMIGNTEMQIVYHRPSLDGRDVMKLVNQKHQGVWRTGANNNTLITFNKDVKIGGETLKAGTYSLFSIPGDSEWTIIINSVTDKWGTQYSGEGNDVMRFMAKATKTSDHVETFTIGMTDFDKNSKDKANIELAWGNISVKFPIQVTN